MSSRPIRHLAELLISTAIASTAAGQWDDDTGVNVLVSGLEGQAAITHSVAAAYGGTWVAWYDAAEQYDVHVQLLDASGFRTFPTSIEVADQSLSWVQDFDLACDLQGNAAIAFSDGDRTRVLLVNPMGTLLYDHTFDGGGDFCANAQVCCDSEGLIVVGWAQEDESYFQRLRPDGTFVWAEPVVVRGTGFTIVSDIKAGDDGSVIASFVHYLSFSGAKRLKVQRITSGGELPWGAAAIDVFTAGSLQYGNYPEFIADGEGGGIFTWYTVSPLTSRIQWINYYGRQLLGTNGITVTTESSMVHVSPTACLDEATGQATVFWVRQNSSQSSAGVQANRITRLGVRLWGSNGRQIVTPTTTHSILDLHAESMGDLACAAWLKSTVSGNAAALAAAMDAKGEMAWGDEPTALTHSNDKSIPRRDLSTAIHPNQLIAAWTDDRLGSYRIFAQNVLADGSLGQAETCPGDLSGDGVVNTTDVLRILNAWGDCGMCGADIDGDGSVGVTDLLIVLGAWGEC